MSNLERKTVVQLKELLKEHGLSTSGVKSDLVDRLESYYEKKKKKVESSSEEEKPKRGKGKKQAKKKEESESESEEKPKRGKGKKQTKKKEESESESEEKPKKGTKRKLEEDEDTEKQPAKKSKIFIKVDELCRVPGASVYDDWAVTLNQTNVGENNNKYYIIQLLAGHNKTYYCFTRWGRVGEKGKSQVKANDLSGAKADFEKKFKDKTKNEWSHVRGNHSAFVKKPKQYDWIEMDHEVDDEEVEELQEALKSVRGSSSGKVSKVRSSNLEKPTKELIDLIFNHDMFKQQMVKFDLNVNELPLGKISQAQINKGYGVLDEIEQAIKTKSGSLASLSGKFFTQIPHSFGRKVPPVISTLETVQQKRDMLAVLGDIELAAELQQNKKNAGPPPDEVDHPSDVNYKLLDADLEPLNKKSDEFEVLKKYLNSTMGDNNFKIDEIFKVNRHNESDRFSLHDSITNRKLLWHGTNVAVVVAILKSGLRIMPHSGGRVGRGIYFASENSKSANYVTPAGSTGIMFLNEVALGKEHHITDDDSSLTRAPPGYDCVIAKGWTEPDPSKDVKLSFDNHEVVVPQGKPIKLDKYEDSSFSQTEYLVYKESQNRIRYLLKLSMG